MKTFSTVRLLRFSALAALLGASINLQATTIGLDYLLGTVVPASAADLASETARLNFLIASYNGGKPDGVVTNAADLTHTYVLDPGSFVPAPNLSLATSNGGQVNVAGGNTSWSINFGSTSYDWLLAKWGDDSAFYYVGGLTGINTLTNDLFFNQNDKPLGLSHYVLFNGHSVSVPDYGATFGLLALALGLLIGSKWVASEKSVLQRIRR